MWIGKPGDLISKILSPALRLWLRSQLEAVEELEIAIEGRDRQILSGYVPAVLLNSRRAIYQGLHLGEIELSGENIRINIGQVVKGKPLQLLEPIRVGGQLCLEQADLQASLPSEILSGALRELLVALIAEQGIEQPEQVIAPYHLTWQEIRLETNLFTLKGWSTDPEGNRRFFTVESSIALINGTTLLLSPKILEGIPQLNDLPLAPFAVNLGTDVELDCLTLEAGQLVCRGRLLVRP